jgi:uncharacterized protein (TIGR04255 family)
MNWEPAHADHSIDNVVILASFEHPLDPDTFDEMVVAVRKSANSHGFTQRSDQQEPLQIATPPVNVLGAGQNVMISIGGSDDSIRRRVIYREIAEGAVIGEFSVGAQSVSLTTARYRRWANFSKTFIELFQTLDKTAQILSKTKSIRLQYVDRFLSIPGGGNHFEVLSPSSPYIVEALKHSSETAFHVHSGWFDMTEPGVRKLTNVNVDVNDLSGPLPPDMKRQLSILCMGQDEALAGALSDPVERAQSLHLYLKNLFGNIISPEAATRVALNPG